MVMLLAVEMGSGVVMIYCGNGFNVVAVVVVVVVVKVMWLAVAVVKDS